MTDKTTDTTTNDFDSIDVLQSMLPPWARVVWGEEATGVVTVRITSREAALADGLAMMNMSEELALLKDRVHDKLEEQKKAEAATPTD